MLSFQWFLWLVVLALVAFYWRDSLRVKEIAFKAAQERCREMQVQLLDEAVYLRRLWLKRNDQGRLALWRAFYFEFTVSGSDRYLGRVFMLGDRAEAVQLQPHRLQ